MTFPRERAVEDEIKDRLDAAMLGYRIAWPAVPFSPVGGETYISCAIVRGPKADQSLRGTASRQSGAAMIEVRRWIDQPDGETLGEGPATDVASDIAARFPVRERIAVDTGWIVFDPAEVLTGFPDGPRWRVPVRVPFVVW